MTAAIKDYQDLTRRRLAATLAARGYTPEEMEEEGYLDHDFHTMQEMVRFWDDDDE